MVYIKLRSDGIIGTLKDNLIQEDRASCVRIGAGCSSGIVSAARGDWTGVLISAIAMVPYVGDLAKLGKLPRLARTVARAVEVARANPRFAQRIAPVMDNLRDALDALPYDSLPDSARRAIDDMRRSLDEFAEQRAAPPSTRAATDPSPGGTGAQSGLPHPGVAGSPRGRRTRISPNDDAPTQRSLIRENESADILARNGYDVEQNPQVPGSRNPDYRIDGRIYDNIAPSTSRVRNIWSTARDKVENGQTDNVVINLADSNVSLSALREQFASWPIDGLNDVIAITRDGSVTRL